MTVSSLKMGTATETEAASTNGLDPASGAGGDEAEREFHDLVRRTFGEGGVRGFDESPPGPPVFDDPATPPPRPLDPEELERLREAQARHWTRFVARPRQERAVTPEAALARLKAARRGRAEGFGKPARPKALDAVEAELGRSLPGKWRAVLQVADGFEVDSEGEPCRVVGTAELVSLQAQLFLY
jgi:hypothetical protein